MAPDLVVKGWLMPSSESVNWLTFSLSAPLNLDTSLMAPKAASELFEDSSCFWVGLYDSRPVNRGVPVKPAGPR